MDWLRRVLSSIGVQLGKLTPTARLLIGAVAVILVMGLFLMSLWASSPDRAEIYPGADASVKRQAIVRLSAAGLDASIDPSGRLVVPTGQADMARGILAEDGVLPSDGQLLFGNLSEHMKWTNPREINQQMVQMALQGELERTIANFPTMRSARVFLDVPEPVGIGLAARKPTASVSVMTADGGAVKQTQVDAVARLVARAVSGLDVLRVSVVDASTGRHLRPTSDDDVLSTSYIEHQHKVEQDVERKVRGLLSHIPGVGVAVTAAVDVKRVTSRREAFLKDGEGSVAIGIESSINSEEQRTPDQGAEPGVRPNTGADITEASADGPEFLAEDVTDKSEARFGSEVTSTIDPRGMPTAVSVSIQIPRGYIAALIAGPDTAAEGGEPADGEAAGPDDAAIEARFEQERTRIAAIIEPHLPMTPSEDGGLLRSGEVAVGLMSVDPPFILAASGAGGAMGGMGFLASGGGSGGFGFGVPFLEQIVLLALAGVAVVMMLLMVRKATKRTELPSAEELVGIPPALEGLADVVGEAGESDSPLEGIELASEDVQAANLLGEVTALVSEQPELAGKLLSRWVDAEP